jgi:hypothetical protein
MSDKTITHPVTKIRPLSTGQNDCHDENGNIVNCAGSGQDAEFSSGIKWPDPRFETNGETVTDLLTGLIWSKNSNPAGFPMLWEESLDFIDSLNSQNFAGRNDWRMPNRKELHSLISFNENKPAIAAPNPFGKIFLAWYWTSTSYAGSLKHAWRVQLEGGRMFFGAKTEYSLLWPVCGESSNIALTGQKENYDQKKRDSQHGVEWPKHRFMDDGETVADALTGLRWMKKADLCGAVSWKEALEKVAELSAGDNKNNWRMPNIRELESLIDASQSYPALSDRHPFTDTGDVYWSSTSSSFEYDWAMALYLDKGAVGVGFKTGDPFLVWPVADINY